MAKAQAGVKAASDALAAVKKYTPDDIGEKHEVQFLEIKTDRGVLTMANHNEHNGWYGGFWIVAEAA